MFNHIRTVLSALVIALLPLAQPSFCAQTIRDESEHFSVELPEPWTAMPAEYVQRINDLISQRMPGSQVHYSRGFMPKGAKDGSYPYILVQFTPADFKNVSYEQLEATLSRSTGKEVKSVENAMSDLAKDLTMGVPVLDRSKNVFLARVQMDVVGAGKVQGLSIGHLSSAGIVQLHSYQLEKDFQTSLPVFNQINDSFKFDPGYEFTPGTGRGALGNILSKAGDGAITGGAIGGVAGLLLVLFKKRNKPKPPDTAA